MRKRALGLLILSCFSFLAAPRAQAITFGDAALTIGISVGAGAILGASTLPFYSQPSDHSKNIFIGAAVGAVAGVLISAAAGVKDSDGEETLRQEQQNALYALSSDRSAWSRPDALASAASAHAKKGETIFWSPLAKLEF